MNILCIETSAGNGSVALCVGDSVYESHIETPRAQTEQLIARIDELLTRGAVVPGQLDAIGFGCGPGSFIGVRLGSAVAQGIAAAAGVGLAPVSSMTTLAAQFAPADAPATQIMVCLDARMGEVYTALYRFHRSVPELQSGESLVPPEAVVWPETADWSEEVPWAAVGSGFVQYPQLREAALERAMSLVGEAAPRARDALAQARYMAQRGELVSPADWQGRYLRDASAWQTM